ncbi:MAG: sugar transferase [Lachnospiraceae bacterium]|nr:sugar transferase [Lachnospiraceae bacterium]
MKLPGWRKNEVKSKGLQRGIKRAFDLIVSLFIVVVFIPIWIIVAILIKATSPGPVFFLQDRPGYHKKIFKVYKFRTMKIGSEKMVKGQEVMKDDDRVTSVGKFLRRSKMDELPQILNVLKGEMSLIGPRPERVASLEDYDDEISKRLNMLPGMTGLAQVSGNIYLSLADRYKLDVYYVEHFSLWLDIKILLRTVGVVLLGEEKYLGKELVKIDEKNSDYRSQ